MGVKWCLVGGPGMGNVEKEGRKEGHCEDSFCRRHEGMRKLGALTQKRDAGRLLNSEMFKGG